MARAAASCAWSGRLASAAQRQATSSGILWQGGTARPSAEWIARQLTEALRVEGTATIYIVRDRDGAYCFIRRLRAMGIRDRPISARSPLAIDKALPFVTGGSI